MTKRTISIEIYTDLPRELGPNRSRYTHWGKISQAKTKLQKETANSGWAAIQWYKQTNDSDTWEPMAKAVVDFTFRLPRRRDNDNAVASMKAALDVLQVKTTGKIAGIGLIKNDSGFKIGKISWEKIQGREPMVALTIKEL